MVCLPLAKVQQKMNDLKGWNFEGNAIAKEVQLQDFDEVIKYVDEIAKLAKEKKHYPDFFVIGNSLRIILSTKGENCVTDKDFELAKQIDDIG